MILQYLSNHNHSLSCVAVVCLNNTFKGLSSLANYLNISISFVLYVRVVLFNVHLLRNYFKVSIGFCFYSNKMFVACMSRREFSLQIVD